MQLRKYLSMWHTGKYLLTAAGFAIWMLFFDDRDIITTYIRHRNELQQLQQSRRYYEEQITATRKELSQLKLNAATIEKYAREKYLMKRDNEDLFLMPER